MITCYRTPEFNKYCREYPRGAELSLADTVVSWEAMYGPRTIRFSEDIDLAYGIPRPTENLYLGYSHVTGTLNQMQVS